jgi:hypothetical protein
MIVEGERGGKESGQMRELEKLKIKTISMRHR